jgi:alkylation response protein AidB-like acyl-CoA dehydrogenase
MYSIWRWGSEEQKQRWLPPMHTGEAIGCFGLTEPDAGSDPGSMRTHARRDGSDWILNGAKMWITSGTIADVAVVWAMTDEPGAAAGGAARGAAAGGAARGPAAGEGARGSAAGAGARGPSDPSRDHQSRDRKGATDQSRDRKGAVSGGVRGFLVEKGMPGYTARDIPHKMSLRASVTSELFFDNVRVPESNRLPEAAGLAAPLSCLTQARYGIAWGAIGAAQACYREAVEFARQRALFGSPLIHKQAIQIRLADMLRRITTAQLLALQLGRLKDEGRMHHSQVSLAKWNNVRMGLDVAREARDILGAGGISVECSPVRHMLNLESVITYEGTETIHQLIVGREIAGGVGAF